jgi:uncharacterized protein (DUF488 family)
VTVFTIGHSTRPLDELVSLLSAHGVALLADVRTIPRSRRNPQFDIKALSVELPRHGVRYVHLQRLGGLRRPLKEGSPNGAWRNDSFRGYADHMLTDEFRSGLEELLVLAEQETACVMCAEAVPWRCHRSLLADALVARGVEVRHIVSATHADPHRPPPFAHFDGTRVTYPPTQLELGHPRGTPRPRRSR